MAMQRIFTLAQNAKKEESFARLLPDLKLVISGSRSAFDLADLHLKYS